MTDTVTTYDVVAIGNAIVDVLAKVSDDFVEENNLTKGSMALMDAAKAGEIYELIDPERECSGGSAANTVAALASFGATPAFIGKVHDDMLGNIFRRDIGSAGVEFFCTPLNQGPSTARCIVLVTPDAQRTMNTYLGASVCLTPDDILEEVVTAGKILYIEGYLWDEENAKQALLKACTLAKKAGREVAFSLSDSFCVERHRDDFKQLIADYVDILFANESELKSLYQTDDFYNAVKLIRKDCKISAITREAKGSVVASGKITVYVDAEEVVDLVDTTGAGDLYAAGFLYGYTQGKDLGTCARIGGIAAAEIITHYGARPEVSLRGLIRSKLKEE